MPKYNYHLKNGKVMTLEGDTPPSDNEVESLAKEQNVELQPNDNTQSDIAPAPVTAPIQQSQIATKPTEQGLISKGWDELTKSRWEGPSRFAKSISDYVNPNRETTGLQGIGSGYIEALGEQISGLSSILNLGTLGLGTGATTAAKAGLPTIAKALSLGTRAAGAGMVAHGGSQVYSGETIPDKLMGGVEAVLGLIGMNHGPNIEPKSSNLSRISEPVSREPIRAKLSIEEPSIPQAPIQRGNLHSIANDVINTENIDVNGPDILDEYTKNISGFPESNSVMTSSSQEPLNWNNDPQKLANQKRVIESKRATGELPPRNEPSAIKDVALNNIQQDFRDGKISEAEALDKFQEVLKPDLMDEYQNSVKGPVKAGTPWMNDAGEVIGHTTDNEGSTGLKLNEPEINSEISDTQVSEKPNLLTDESGVMNINAGEPKLSTRIIERNGQYYQQTGVNADTGKPTYKSIDKRIIPPEEVPIKTRNITQQVQAAKTAPPSVRTGLIQKLEDAQREILTGFDLSFVGRQGKGLVTHKGYWQAFDDMFRAFGSKKAHELVNESIINHPSGLFKPGVDIEGNETPSYSQKVGLKLSDFYGNTEETIRSHSLEQGKYNPLGAFARGNKAFINKARSDVFASLIDELKRRGDNPINNIELGKEIANSVNVSSGKGNMGKFNYKSINPDTGQVQNSIAMQTMNKIFFAPEFVASRVQMFNRVLNPINGALAPWSKMNPVIRKEALRSLFGIVGTGLLIQEMARQAGALVINDPTNPDFRKIHLGKNTRIDNFSGLGPYGVGTAQFLMGQKTSSNSGRTTNLVGGFGSGKPKFGAQTTADLVANFAVNRLAPIPSLLISWMRGKDFDGKSFEWKKAIANRTAPLVAQDIYDLAQEDPSLIPAGILPILGEGIQTYGR